MEDAVGMVVPAPVLRRLSSVLTRVTDPTDPATRARSIEERPRRALLRLPDVPEALMRRPTVDGREPNPPDASKTDSSLLIQHCNYSELNESRIKCLTSIDGICRDRGSICRRVGLLEELSPRVLPVPATRGAHANRLLHLNFFW